MPAKSLTPKQEAFAKHYALHDNGAEAYRHAYSAERMTDPSIWSEASRVLANPLVASRVDTLRKEIEQTAKTKFNLTAEELLNHFKEIAFMDFGIFFDWDAGKVTLKSKDDLTELQRQMITSIKQTKGNTNSIEVTFVSKDKALDRLATYLGLNKVQVDHNHTHELKDAAADFDSKFDSFAASLREAKSTKSIQ